MNNLKKLRKKKGYRQTDLSKLTGITQNTISRMETGTVQRVSHENAYSLALILECDIEDLGLTLYGEERKVKADKVDEVETEHKPVTKILNEPPKMYKYL